MIELLKKIGIPATIAAVIASLVTMVPLLFKLDERYAKEEDLTAQTARTEKAINELTVEISRLAGTQQVVVSMMSAGAAGAPRIVGGGAPVRIQTPADLNDLPASNAGPAPVIAQAASAPVIVKPAPKIEEVSRTLRDQQTRLNSLKY